MGPPPFITKNPLGGSAVIVTEILAQKHFFTPKYIRAKFLDKVEQNNKIVGMVHLVSLKLQLEKHLIWASYHDIIGFDKA